MNSVNVELERVDQTNGDHSQSSIHVNIPARPKSRPRQSPTRSQSIETSSMPSTSTIRARSPSDGTSPTQPAAKRQRQHSSGGGSPSPRLGAAPALLPTVGANSSTRREMAILLDEDSASETESGMGLGGIDSDAVMGELSGNVMGEISADEDEGEREGELLGDGAAEGAAEDEEEDDEDEDEDEDGDDDDDEEEQEESEDDSESDDSDDNGSVDLEGSPVFISSSRPLGISDLIEQGTVHVKNEPLDDGDAVMDGMGNVGLGISGDGLDGLPGAGESSQDARRRTASLAAPTSSTITAGGLAPPNHDESLLSEPPTSAGAGLDLGAPPIVTNILVAKKAPKRKRLVLPPTPPPQAPKPIVTIRLAVDLGTQQKTLIANFKDQAREQNIVPLDYFDVQVGPKSDGEMSDEEGNGVGKKLKSQPTAVGVNAEQSGNGAAVSGGGIASLFDGGGGLADADDAQMQRLAAELEAKYDKPTKKKKIVKGDKYDVADPFIDDSELIVDEPTYYIRPKKDGYYVQKGPVELMGQTPEKPKHRKVNGNGILPPAIGNGVIKKKKQPIGLGYRPGAPSAQKKGLDLARPAVTSSSHDANSSRNALNGSSPTRPSNGDVIDVDALPDDRSKAQPPARGQTPQTRETFWPTFPPEIQEHLRRIDEQVKKETFRIKKLFPEALKPLVQAGGEKAIDLNCFGEGWFRALCFSLPYNKFTMKKQQLTLTHVHHLEVFASREAALIEDLRVEIEKIIGEQVQAHDQAVAEWRESVNKGQIEANPSDASKPTIWAPDQEESTVESATPASNMPTPKFRFNRECRDVFWLLIKNQNSWMNMMNEYKATVKPDGDDKQLSEVTCRNALYMKLLPYFPAGWMSTTFLSREMSAIKKRVENAAVRTGIDDGAINPNGTIGQIY